MGIQTFGHRHARKRAGNVKNGRVEFQNPYRRPCRSGINARLQPTVPRGKLIEPRIELRRSDPLDQPSGWPHFEHIGRTLEEGAGA